MLNLTIITPERTVYDEKVSQVTLSTTEGEITILPHHIPLFAVLSAGVMTIKKGSEEFYLSNSGGFVEVKPKSQVTILADTAERAEELTEEAVLEARERAKKLLTEKRQVDDVSAAAAAASLERELARLRVIKKHRHKGAPAVFKGETE